MAGAAMRHRGCSRVCQPPVESAGEEAEDCQEWTKPTSGIQLCWVSSQGMGRHVCFTLSALSPQPCSRQRELEKTRLRLPHLGWYLSAGESRQVRRTAGSD